MLKITAHVAPSPVHGQGLFAAEPIAAGTVLWRYVPGVDSYIRVDRASPVEFHFGCINPRNPALLMRCGDRACYWNFPPEGTAPNCVEGPLDRYGEALIVAARDIAAGEELLIDPATDADAHRKLNHSQAA